MEQTVHETVQQIGRQAREAGISISDSQAGWLISHFLEAIVNAPVSLPEVDTMLQSLADEASRTPNATQ